MKKAYTKPGIYVENFAVSQSVAVACGVPKDSTLGKPGYNDSKTCGWDMGNLIIWAKEETCRKDGADSWIVPENTPMDGVCYNNPNGGVSIFTCS